MNTFKVLGFRPPQHHPNSEYLFVDIVAILEPQTNRWTKLANPVSIFPPRGTVFVPPELIPDSFQGQPDGAAVWIAADQPNWAGTGIGARYRATHLLLCPPEVIDIPCLSKEYDATRRLLLYDGVDHIGGVQGQESVMRFRDGVIAGPIRLLPKAGAAKRYYCTENALTEPMRAWKPDTLELCPLPCNGSMRRFLAREGLPETDLYLDFASLETVLKRMALRGGIAASTPDTGIDVKKLTQQISSVLRAYPNTATFTARRCRLEQLLDTVSKADVAWDSWQVYLEQHPRFNDAVKDAASGLRKEIEAEVRKEFADKEKELITWVQELEVSRREEEGLLQAVKEEVEHKQEERDLLELELSQFHADRDHLTRQPQTTEKALVSEEVPNPLNSAVDEVPKASHLQWHITSCEQFSSLESAEQVIAHLEKNFQQVGLLPASSLILATEVLVAASLGQAVLFRGSFSSLLAEVTAVSLSGRKWCRLSVPIGCLDQIPLPEMSSATSTGAIVLEGVNRSCFDAYGENIGHLLQERALGLHISGSVRPVVIGTLLDGPSCLPQDPVVMALGFVCDSDLLSWKARRGASYPAPGQCSDQAWKMPTKRFLMRTPESPNGRPISMQWQRNLVSAGDVLSGSDERQALISALCGWIIPYFSSLGIHALPEEMAENVHEVLDDSRVRLHLAAGGIEVPS